MNDDIFVEEVLESNITDPIEILNWYRNLYYREPVNTERDIMADAINDLFMEIEELKADNKRLRDMWAKAVSDLSKCQVENKELNKMLENAYEIIGNMIDR